MPRDNLLNSACLELFEFIKRENIKMLIQHIVESFREKLQGITYVDTFQNLILRFDQMNEPATTQELEHSFTSVDSDTPARPPGMTNGGKWSQGLKEVDADEEAYFNTSDDEDEIAGTAKPAINGASPVRPLVNYPDDDDDDDDDDDMDILGTEEASAPAKTLANTPAKATRSTSPKSTSSASSPPERISEKRRREEDEEDELLANISTSTAPKRRASTSSNTSTTSLRSLRRKSPQISSGKDGGAKKIAIVLPVKSGGEGSENE
jgi:protein phosphatase-4 regulatory subunit 3